MVHATFRLFAVVLATFLQVCQAELVAEIPIDEGFVRGLFFAWNEAVLSGDSAQVTRRYAKNATLLPTVSDTPRTDPDSIKEYFDKFLELKPSGQILSGDIMIGEGWAQDAGIYEFSFSADSSRVKARYTYVYVLEDGHWKIAHHHSSVLPEGQHVPHNITEDEVRELFTLWNDALATGEPELVADRYAADAVLLPTLSDVPRSTRDLLLDYFEGFLPKKPQGTIIESFVYIGTDYAEDVGIYEFTFGADGSKAKARYSFIYVWEEDQWKIQHHHSSLMPEGIATPAQAITQQEVRELFDVWNDALATLDPDTVVALYADNSTLLPTVSDTVCNTAELKKEYFEKFLLKKPQGTILSGDIYIGYNWAEDAGIYEFTMGADGSKVKARYTYVYVYEDGWKIAHHHSSVMPEAYL